MRLTSFIIILITLSFSSAAQKDPCNCCSDQHKQFDFWVGEWEVYDHRDTLVGKNTILKLQGNCLLQENWTSKTMTGTSYNWYNQTDSTWNQVWVDNQGYQLELKGKFRNGRMVMKSKLLKGQNVDRYYNQISWEAKQDGSVVQIWEIYDKENKLIREIFRGIYKRKTR
jgi:hypothetical protein